jgi:F0F1-type ATP synthase assembly protein I
MVPYHRPIPKRKQRDKAGDAPSGEQSQSGVGGGMMSAWVQAEKLMQIAMMLPCAGFIGWLAGYGLDRWLHQTWIGMAGAVFGIVAGLVGAVRMATIYANDPAMNKLDENGNDADTSGKNGDSGKAS